MKKIGFILLGIICILFSSRWALTSQAGCWNAAFPGGW